MVPPNDYRLAKFDREDELHVDSKMIVAKLGVPLMKADDAAVMIFHVPLNTEKPSMKALSSVISVAEQKHASRFVNPLHGRRFGLSRLALRQVLAIHCKCPAAAIDLQTGHYGRPFVHGLRDLDFNLSHSDEWAVIALSANTTVGVDIQASVRVAYLEGMFELACTAEEQRILGSLPVESQCSSFMKYWTAKEAFMKLNGFGLRLHPSAIAVNWMEQIGNASTALRMVDQHKVLFPKAHLTQIPTPLDFTCTLATAFKPREISVDTFTW